MEESQPQSQATCTLKVNIKCCKNCRTKAKEKLQKMKGMEFIEYDSKGVLTISGKFNPLLIAKKIEKWGRKAELLPWEQSSNQADSKYQTDNRRCCHGGSDSDSDKSEKSKGPNGQSSKNKARKWCFGFFSKSKPKVTMVRTRPSQFSRMPMLGYGGGPMSYYQQAFRPYHPASMMGRPLGPLHYPFGVMQPPPYGVYNPQPPPYGVYNPRPPPSFNPMVHYSSYADNYIPW